MKNKPWRVAAALAAMTLVQPVSSSEMPAPNRAYSGAGKVLVPSKGWTCGMPAGIPVPERGVLVFEAKLELDQIYDVGVTPYGARKAIVIRGGEIVGEKIKGTVMAGSLDFQLTFSTGASEVEQVLVLKTTDGKYIYVRSAGTAADEQDVRIVPDFEAPGASDYSWLNTGKYVGRRVIDLAAKTMKLTVYDVARVVVEKAQVSLLEVNKPAGLPDQPWNYRLASTDEKRGEQLTVENVALAPSQSVGATKNGGRNIIPITGGTISGKINGKVLFGGADYQKMGNPFTLDARYLWQTEEGEVIIVRNAGPVAKLVPVFEARIDSKYAWLNQGTYLSSGPAMGAGGVSLTFYESTP